MTVRKSLVIIGAILFVTAVVCLGVSVSAAGPTTVPASDPNAACVNCHSLDLKYTFHNGEVLSAHIDYAKFQTSIHGAIVTCSVCHANIASNATLYPHPTVTAATIKDYQTALNQVCAGCHSQASKDTLASVHGMQNGTQIAVCTDCHSSHDTLAVASSEYKLASVTACSKCHGNDELMKQYGLSTNVVNSYLQDFHGKTSYLVGEEAKNLSVKTAVCSDCHGSHNIVLITPANEDVIQANFTAACQKCHSGVSTSFTGAWLSHNQPSTTYAQAVFVITWFYRVMIAFVLLGLFIHIGFDVYVRSKKKIGG